jgi:hypothetical protein
VGNARPSHDLLKRICLSRLKLYTLTMETPNCSNQMPAANSRRDFLRQTGLSMGSLAFGTMLARGLLTEVRADAPLSLKARSAPLPAKAKHIIHIFAQGAPSHLDTFDYKPAMKDLAEKSKAGQAGVFISYPF